jgi:hypothetical protein
VFDFVFPGILIIITIIEISVPADHRVEGKEKEKVDKYQGLRIEIERLWKN